MPEVARLSDWLDKQESLLDIPARMAFAVRLCLEEVVANLINHTPAKDVGAEVAVDLTWQDRAMVVTVEDHGPPFDPRTVAEPRRPVSLEAAEPDGRGIHLIRSFASEIDYAVLPDTNRLTLWFRQPANDGAATGGG